MAKGKGSTSELEKKLKMADELFDSVDVIIKKYKNFTSIENDDKQELEKQMNALKKMKDTLGKEAPIDTKEKIDQAIDKLKSILEQKPRTGKVSDEEKQDTLELFEETMEHLNKKQEELQSQLDGQGRKKAKNQSKELKISVENIEYHISKLEEVRQLYEAESTVEQDSNLRDILSYMQDYLDDAEYSQEKQSDYLTGLYESFFEKQEEILAAAAAAQENEAKISSASPGSAQKEEESIKSIIEGSVPLETPVSANGKKSFMERIRQNNFEHEVQRMPKITENDLKGEFNFFDMFEASAKNVPQESDYYPNASIKERISTKNIYPKRKLVGEQLFERFDVDALFFIFYFQKDTYEQYLAANELKKRAWRFHKKYLTWFKRLGAPRVNNDEYEQGTYAFFDFEQAGWCQRKKNDFTFKYYYLEDEKL